MKWFVSRRVRTLERTTADLQRLLAINEARLADAQAEMARVHDRVTAAEAALNEVEGLTRRTAEHLHEQAGRVDALSHDHGDLREAGQATSGRVDALSGQAGDIDQNARLSIRKLEMRLASYQDGLAKTASGLIERMDRRERQHERAAPLDAADDAQPRQDASRT